MKSAYEKAMERMEREKGPVRKLSGEQKERVAGIDTNYDAKIAEARLAHDAQIALVADPEERMTLENQLASEVRSLEEKREREKEAVWNEGS